MKNQGCGIVPFLLNGVQAEEMANKQCCSSSCKYFCSVVLSRESLNDLGLKLKLSKRAIVHIVNLMCIQLMSSCSVAYSYQGVSQLAMILILPIKSWLHMDFITGRLH